MPIIGQLRGAEYAIAEIVWWMLAAALIGAAVGWLVRGFRQSRAVEAEYRGRLETAEAERTKALAERDRVAAELESASQRAAELEASLNAEKQRSKALEATIEQHAASAPADEATQETLFAESIDPLPDEKL